MIAYMTHEIVFGRKPKSPEKRVVTQVKLPSSLTENLIAFAEEHDLSRSDLGAFLMLTGYNSVRARRGLEPVPFPGYLEALIDSAFGDVEDKGSQDPMIPAVSTQQGRARLAS